MEEESGVTDPNKMNEHKIGEEVLEYSQDSFERDIPVYQDMSNPL
jgi:hypothetical protein